MARNKKDPENGESDKSKEPGESEESDKSKEPGESEESENEELKEKKEPMIPDSRLVEIALDICCNDVFKRNVLSAQYPNGYTPYEAKVEWDRKVISLTRNMLLNYEYLHGLEGKVFGAVLAIAMRMLTWIEYYVGTFDLTREFCIKLLDHSLFTPEGIIDHKKVKERLTERNFNNVIDFKIACYYSQMQRIPDLYRALTNEEQKLFYDKSDIENIKQLDIVRYWSYFLNGRLNLCIEVDELSNVEVPVESLLTNLYRKKCVVTSAIHVLLDSIARSRRYLSVDCASSLVAERARLKQLINLGTPDCVDDWVAFRQSRYDFRSEYWIPDHFFVDAFYHLISKVKEKERLEDIVRRIFIMVNKMESKKRWCSQVLETFLRWPYLDTFLDLIKVGTIPEAEYSFILSEIVDRIDIKEGDYLYGESMFYDYREYLKAAWKSINSAMKNEALSTFISSKRRRCRTNEPPTRTKYNFLTKFLNRRRLDMDDFKIVRLVLNTTNYEAKSKFLKSDEVRVICLRLLTSDSNINKLIFEKLVAKSFKEPDEVKEFKKTFYIDEDSCLEYIRNDKYEQAETILQWFDMKEDDLIDLKRSVVRSSEGKKLCREFCMRDYYLANEFVNWAFMEKTKETPREVNIERTKYIKSLLSDEKGLKDCQEILLLGLFENVNRLINWCLPVANDAVKFKIDVITEPVKKCCLEKFNCDYAAKVMENNPEVLVTQIVNWREVANLLTWCFGIGPSRQHFKQTLIEKEKGLILSKFIGSNKWEEAGKFMELLNLSLDEEKEFKRDVFFERSPIKQAFYELMYKEQEGKKSEIKRFLLFFLIDKIAVNEFKATYRDYSEVEEVNEVIKLLEHEFSD